MKLIQIRKSISLTILTLIAFLINVTPILAQSEAGSSGKTVESQVAPGIARPDIYPYPKTTPTFLGQNHSYSVVFRGNGEAIVTGRMAFTNLSDTSLNSYTLQFGKINPTDVTVYQVIKEPTCIRYGSIQGSASDLQKPIIPPCLEYQEPDYYQPYWGQSQYNKADFELKGDTLTVTLPKPLKSQSSGAIFVYFRASGFAKRDIVGAYPFTFTTLKVNDKIQNLQVGISTDSDLILKNATGAVDYRVEDAVSELRAAPQAAGSVKSPAFDNFYNQIGYGTIVKTASNLAASETYEVKGKYADNRIKLYAQDVLVGLVIFLGLVLLGVVVIFFVSKVIRAKKVTAIENPIVKASLLSFSSAFATTLYTVFFVFILNTFSRSVDIFGYYVQQNFSMFIFLFIGVISLGIYILLIFGPAIYMGMKYGVWWAVGLVVMTIVWLVLFGVIVFLGMFLFGIGNNVSIGYPRPMPAVMEASPPVELK